MDTKQLDPSSSYQAGSSSYRPMYPLYIGWPPYGEQYAHSPYPPFSGQPRITVCQWQPSEEYKDTDKV